MKTRLAIFMLGLALLGAAETASAQSTGATYDVQFGAGGGASQTGAAVIGQVGDHWNRLTSAAGMADLLDTAGRSGSVVFSWAGDGAESFTSPFGGGVANLMGGYIFARTGQNMSFSALPADRPYALYIYTQGDSASAGRRLAVTVNGTTHTSASTVAGATAFVAGQNYLKIMGTTDGGGNLRFTYNWTVGEANINGIQLQLLQPFISAPPASQAVAAGGTLNLSVTAAGSEAFHYQWFKNGGMVSGATNRTLTRAGAAMTDSGVYTVAVTNAYGLSISTPVTVKVGAPHLFTWGRNAYGQLGDGTTFNRCLPVSVASNVVGAAAGFEHSLFIKGDGTLWAMGSNQNGQLGDGTSTHRSNAVFVASNVATAAAGALHSLFVKNDGTLWAIGYNFWGQLGDGTTTQRNSPVSVASNVVAVAAGLFHSLFLKGDGTLWAMGINGDGELGDGTSTQRNSPVSVASNVVALTAGFEHSLFMKGDGTLWTMGSNQNGQLGDGTTSNRFNAVCVASRVTDLAAGELHSLFLKSDGTLWAMGQNTYGQLGDGTPTQRNSPVSVTSNVTSLTAGSYYSMFLKSNGSLWGMGYNDKGQLGNGTTISQISPVAVAGMSLSSIVSCNGADHTLAVGEPQPLTITRSPTNQTVGAFGSVAFTVEASGFAPLAYQWYFNNGAISGATATNYILAGVSAANAGSYSVVVSNPGGCMTSSVAVLTVLAPPAITEQPARQQVASGGTLAMSVTAVGVGSPHYQWFKNGGMVLDATNSTLTRAGAAVTDSGVYYVAITNAYGMSLSTPVTVTVGAPHLFAWGRNDYGQLGDGTHTDRHSPISVAGSVVTAAAGADHSLFVKGDGTLWAVGYNGDGELGDGTKTTRSNAVSTASEVVAVAGAVWHSLYVKGDGTLWAMGQNDNGQLGDGTLIKRTNAVLVASNVVATAGGIDDSLFLKSDGTLWAMGLNNYGQLGDGTLIDRHLPVPVASNVVALAAGFCYSLFLKVDGTLWAMGRNNYGQLGDGTLIDRHLPVPAASNVVALAAGEEHSLYVKGDGTMWAMGRNNYGQLGDGTLIDRHLPVPVASNAVDLAAGINHSLYMKGDGTLWAMGNNNCGQFGNGTTTSTNRPTQVVGLSLATVRSCNAADHSLGVGEILPPAITGEPTNQTVAAGGSAFFTVIAGGFEPLAYQWYFNGATVISGATSNRCTLAGVTEADSGGYTVVVSNPGGSVTSSVAVLTVLAPPAITAQPARQQVAPGGTLNLSVTAAGNEPFHYQWFKNGAMVLGATNGTLTRSNAAVTDSGVYYVAITNAYGMSISTPVTVAVGSPHLFAWGWNVYGQLGDGTESNRSNAVDVAGNVVAAAAGEGHSLVLKGDGTLWATGRNAFGQLGDGTTASRQTPLSVASNVVSLSAGADHSLFLKNDGTLWAMGLNAYGELGDGTTIRRNSPVAVASNVVAVAAGSWHSLFLKGDGTLWAMGLNSYGQLGDGTTTNRSRAVCMASNVVTLAAGADHSLFLKNDGTLWATGYNGDGELGDGTKTQRNSPVAVASNVSAVAAGSWHSLFLKGDGMLWAMGQNYYGQLGDGSMVSRSNAVFVTSNVTALTAGIDHSLFLKGDGTLWAMGKNNYGQLGDGTTTYGRLWPVPVSGMSLTAVVSGCAANHSLAVGTPLPLTITRSPTNQTAWAFGTAAFKVEASGFAPLAYQWYFNGGAISGATATNYILAGVSAANAGSYMAVVSNPECSVTSGVAVLTVTLIASSVDVSSSTNMSVYGDLVTFTAHVSPGTASGTVIFKDGTVTLGAGTLTNGTTIFATHDLSAGGHGITAEFGGDGDHAVSDSAPLSQTVDKAVLTAAALPQTRAYGVANPELTFTLSGYVNGEGAGAVTGSPSLTTGAVTGSDVGDYAIDVGPGTLSAANYAFAFVPGTLTVTQAPASVTLIGLSQTYDGTPKSVTATTTPEGLTVALTYDGSTTAPTAAGSYAVIGTVNEPNWQGSAGGTLTIAKIDQAISFAVIAPQPVAGAVGLSASASSGLSVSFSVLSGPGSIADGTNLTFSAPGIVAVAASQAGDAVYGAAPDVTNLIFVYTVIPDNGPFQGGNAVTLNSGSPGMITNVQVGGVSAGIRGADTNGLTLIMPAIGSAGIKDIVVQTSDNGDFTLSNAYTVNPAGWIGGSRLEPSGWEGFGSGVSGSSVYALALDGASLYAGGDFTIAGGVAANRVALWNGLCWTSLGTGISGSAVYALAHDGANLYAGGDFTNAGGMAANSVAMWNGTVWTCLGSGLSGTVRALAHDGQYLYAGGTFTTAGGVAANYVAMWNGTSWTNLDSGVNSWVRALAHDGTNLIVGGYFTVAGGVAANHVARWNGTSWEALGSGLNNDVRALTLVGTNLVAGGDFTAAGDGAANAVALWNGTGWTALGSGMNDSVTALAYDGVNLVAGGYFTAAGGVAANCVAQWNGEEWTALGSGMNGVVKALAHDGTDLFVGGDFTEAGGVPVHRVAVWGEKLARLSGVAPASGALAGGYTVTISGENLCNGSDVTNVTLCGVAVTAIQSQSATQIVVTAGMAVSTGLGDARVCSASFGETVSSDAFTYLADQTVSFAALAPQPLAAQVGLAATASSGLPVSFRVVSGPGTITDKTNLTFSAAGLVTIAASQAGDALYGTAPDVVNSVHVYTVVPDNGPFAGGNTVALNIGTLGTVTGVRVAGEAAAVQGIDASGVTLAMPATGSAGMKEIVVQTSDHGDFTLADAYTVNPAGQIGGSATGPTIWTDLGGGLPGSAVYALAHAGTNLFAGGTFTRAGGVAANDAMWDGSDWDDLGGGMDDTVTALAYDGDHLYAGGYFTTAGGVAANYVAMWDGTVWTSLGSGLDGPVSALVCDGGNLYAGGAFTTAGGITANRVAVWNGTYWTGLGSGVEGSLVTALAHDGTNLVAGGDFTKAGGVAANRVALWNGSSWSRLGSGLNGTVFALELDGTGLVAGGAFTTAGGVSANRVARWNGTSWSALGSGMNDTVRALAHDGSNLYAGGYFTAAGGMAANYVALWDGTGWASLDSGVNSWVRSLAHDGANLFVGGYFTAAGGEAANHVARWAPSVITYANVTPDSGTLSGGYTVTISGANLCNGSDVTNVTLCGVSAAVQSQSATQIVVTAGAAVSLGPGDVRVFSTRFGETVKADAFTYFASPVWNPQVQSGESFGVRSNQFGFTVTGSSYLIVVVEACTNLANPVWVPLETNTLTEGLFYFSDPAWTNYPARFYRLRAP